MPARTNSYVGFFYGEFSTSAYSYSSTFCENFYSVFTSVVQGQGSAAVRPISPVQRGGWPTGIPIRVGMAWRDTLSRFERGGGPRPQWGLGAQKIAK